MRENSPAGIMAEVKSVNTRWVTRPGGRRRVHAPLADPPAYRRRRRARREARVEVGASLLDRRSLRHSHRLRGTRRRGAQRHLLEIGSLGNVRTTTLRAYDEEEMS